MSRFVLDASIVLAWCFPDENSALAEGIAERFKQGDSAIATSFWPHEVLNALLVGEKRGRISKDLVQSFLMDLAMLPVALQQTPAETVFQRIEPLAREYALTAYDAAYLDLCLGIGLPLATLDEDLSRACRSAGAGLVGA